MIVHPEPEYDGPLVYFVQSVNGGPVKIGYVTYAAGLAARVSDLQIASPYPLQVVKTMAGGVSLERKMHNRFARWRLGGEWFLPTKELEAFCGHHLGRRGEAASIQRFVDRAYERGTDDGYDEGYKAGRRSMAMEIFRVVGDREDWPDLEENGSHIGSAPLAQLG